MKALSQSKRWQGDGIFSTVPTGFYQLYTIHGLYKWQMITCFWILLGGKSGILYKKMLNEINNGGLAVGLEMKPEIVIVNLQLCMLLSFIFLELNAVFST